MDNMIVVGSLVRVSNPVGREDRRYRNAYGTLVRYTRPHGYAAVRLDVGGEVLLHPESLSVESEACVHGRSYCDRCDRGALLTFTPCH